MRVLDLFSGIGGFSLGLERAGMRTVGFCEIDPYCRAVLRKHWAAVPIFSDVQLLRGMANPAGDGCRLVGGADGDGYVDGPIDVICGGFPCQDISLAGKGAGLAGERSGLWREFHRLIKEVRPRFVIAENVSALRSRGLDEVLRSLTEIGYDAEWNCIPASAVGAPHRRDRVWIIAYPNGDGKHDGAVDAEVGGASESVADSERQPEPEPGHEAQAECDQRHARVVTGGRGYRLHESSPAQAMADSNFDTWIERRPSDAGEGEGGRLAIQPELAAAQRSGWWESEPAVGRVANGVPSRVDRLRALGNAVVPPVVEAIGRAIMRAEG